MAFSSKFELMASNSKSLRLHRDIKIHRTESLKFTKVFCHLWGFSLSYQVVSRAKISLKIARIFLHIHLYFSSRTHRCSLCPLHTHKLRVQPPAMMRTSFVYPRNLTTNIHLSEARGSPECRSQYRFHVSGPEPCTLQPCSIAPIRNINFIDDDILDRDLKLHLVGSSSNSWNLFFEVCSIWCQVLDKWTFAWH